MPVKMPTECYRSIIWRVERHTDPLGLTAEEAASTSDTVDVVDRALDGMDMAMASRVAADLSLLYAEKLRIDPVDPQQDHRLRDAGAMDRVSAHILAHMGIDPLMVAWAAHVSHGVDLLDHDTSRNLAYFCTDVAPGREDSTSNINLSPTTFWHGEGAIGIRSGQLPDTISTLCEGIPLRKVFSHPALDAHDLTITRVTEINDHLWLVVDADMRALSPGDLLAIAPCGCRP